LEDQIEEWKMMLAAFCETVFLGWFIKHTLQPCKQINEINKEPKPQQDQKPNGFIFLPFFLKQQHFTEI